MFLDYYLITVLVFINVGFDVKIYTKRDELAMSQNKCKQDIMIQTKIDTKGGDKYNPLQIMQHRNQKHECLPKLSRYPFKTELEFLPI